MSEKHENNSLKITNFEVVGLVIGAVLALVFAKTGNEGMMGAGVIIGVAIGKGLDKRYQR